MADPLTLSAIAASCLVAPLTGPIGNWADKGLLRSARSLGTALSHTQTPENHDVLRATHGAWLRSIQVMAELCAAATQGPADQESKRALVKAVRSAALTEFRYKGDNLPLDRLSEIIDGIYEGSPDPAYGATDVTIRVVEAVMGQPLLPNLREVFHHGHIQKCGWAATFQLFFSETIKENERVFRILTFDRLNEVVAAGEAHALEMASIHRTLSEFWQAAAAQLDRIEQNVALLVQSEMERRGREIARAGVADEAVVRLATRISNYVDNPEQALAELGAAVDELLQLRSDARRRGSNLDTDVEAVLRRIDERASAGEFEAADREAERAFREWECREADRRERELAVGIRFAEENIRTKRFLRDAEGVAFWIAKRAAIITGRDVAGYAQLAGEVGRLIDSGRDRGINLDLEIAAMLSRFAEANAADARERAASQDWHGTALATLGGREEGRASLDAAVAAYRAALEVHTRDDLPLDWARTQNNLGATLATLGGREEGRASLDAAVAAYRAALEVFRREGLDYYRAVAEKGLAHALEPLGGRQV